MKLLFLGDFFYDYGYFSKDMEEISKFIIENDYKVILNFESSLGEKGTPIKKRGPNLRSSEKSIDILKKLQCIGVCLANNHAMDYGAEALLDMKDTLIRSGIQCVGIGKNLQEALEPAVLMAGEKKIVLQNYGWNIEETVYATKEQPGCAPLDRNVVIEQTRRIREKDPECKVINIFHWGFEFNLLPMPLDIQFAHECIQAGCSLVIGHHPHVVQPYELYENVPVFYSLGNFYFSSKRNGFQTKYDKEFSENFGDYGLGVIYDTDTDSTETIMIFFNRETGKSVLVKEVDKRVLLDLKKLQWTTESYLELARTHAYKQNPILGMDEAENKKALDDLKRKYWIADKVKFLKKSSLGTKLYAFLKSKA